MKLHKLVGACLLLAVVIQSGLQHTTAQTNPDKMRLLSAMQAAGVNPDDLALMQANLDALSVEQITEIKRFLTNPSVIADSQWFDVSKYANWNDYNYYRPVGDNILVILARRDLFLDPARELDNRTLTNMSPEALAALAFSQVYVEEKWDHGVPWEGDPNAIFNWIHPDLLEPPNLISFFTGDYLYRARTAYWWATYWSLPLAILHKIGIGPGTDRDEVLSEMRASNANPPRLAGYSYPLGNQLYTQTAETVYWYADYLKYGAIRYGPFERGKLDTQINFPDSSAAALQSAFADSSQYSGLEQLFNAPFGAALRVELTEPETAAFWNVMRFLYAGGRQREGGASPDHPENAQPSVFALRYGVRSPMPVGREPRDISAFSLLTTVYSDSILLDFTNWNSSKGTLLVTPSDGTRSDGINRLVSERDKAIRVIEQMGNENAYPNATHIAGSRGLGFSLTTQYDDPVNGDFLPYTGEEANALIMALATEARDYHIESSRVMLCDSPLLKAGYKAYQSGLYKEGQNPSDWARLAGTLCG